MRIRWYRIHVHYAALLCAILSFQALAWNANGHRLVAEIAFHHLTPKAKQAYREAE